jgi:hypothetical protein
MRRVGEGEGEREHWGLLTRLREWRRWVDTCGCTSHGGRCRHAALSTGDEKKAFCSADEMEAKSGMF